MRTVVKKFGGTSVGTLERIRSVAQLCAKYRSEHPDRSIVLVASAMSGETNRLLALAKACVTKPNPRELDALVATGEQQSCALLAMALTEAGLPATSLTAAQIGLNTDSMHLEARIRGIDARRLKSLLERGVIPVVTGFQGISEEGDVTTLGRGGSDITAVAVAAALQAEACFIYTDVPGVFSADPRIVRDAKLLRSISHPEMLELAGLGAKVLHPRCVEFAYRYAVPLVTLSSFAPEAGETWIVNEENLMEEPVVSGVTSRCDEAQLTILAMPNRTDGLARVFAALAENGILVDMITQSGVENDTATVSCLVPDAASDRALEIVQGLVPTLGHAGAALDRDIARVSMVGVGMRTSLDVAAETLKSLAKLGITVNGFNSSDIKISCLIPRKYAEMAVRALHARFVTAEQVADAQIGR